MGSLLSTRRPEIVTTVTVVVLDQIVKALVRPRLALYESVEVIPNLLNLTRVHNTGAAFGMMNTADFPYKTALITMLALVAFCGVAWYALTVPLHERLARIGVACILGGAVGNLIDRVTVGYVLDFVDFYWRGWHFWAFNVADAAITIGVVLMILDILGLGHRASDPA